MRDAEASVGQNLNGQALDGLFNHMAEQAVLGALMYAGGDALARIRELTRAEHFYEPFHARLYDAVVAQIVEDKAVEVGLIAPKFVADPAFADLGGVRYLVDLLDHAPVLASLPDFAGELSELFTKRCLVALGVDLGLAAKAPEANASAILADAERALAALNEGQAPATRNLIDAQTAAHQAVDRLDREAEVGKPRGLLTGLRCFDYRLRGLRPGKLVVLGARPSMGKTMLARSAATAAALRNPDRLMVYFSLEMDRDELSERGLAELSFIHRGRYHDAIPYFEMNEKLTRDQRDYLRSLADRMPPNLKMEDSPVLSLEHIRRRLYALKRQGALGAVFIDYLQIMDRPAAHGRNDALVVQEITSGLKRLALELGICIVLLSQLSRGVESRDDKRPQLSDLRDSGSIEQDADAVLFVYREAYYLRTPPKDRTKIAAWEEQCEMVRREMEVITAKVRRGPVGADKQACFLEYDHVTDMAEAA